MPPHLPTTKISHLSYHIGDVDWYWRFLLRHTYLHTSNLRGSCSEEGMLRRSAPTPPRRETLRAGAGNDASRVGERRLEIELLKWRHWSPDLSNKSVFVKLDSLFCMNSTRVVSVKIVFEKFASKLISRSKICAPYILGGSALVKYQRGRFVPSAGGIFQPQADPWLLAG